MLGCGGGIQTADPLWLCRETGELNVALSSHSAAPRVGGDNLHDSHTDLIPVVCCLLCSEQDPEGGAGKMEDESRRKMKEKFGLRQDIFKEFLAEFLGIFVLIVSIPPCAPVVQLNQPL